MRGCVNIGALICFGLMVCRESHAQQSNGSAETVTAEAIRVPRPEGIVVIRASLDKKGRVISAEALSGSDALIPDSLAKVKKKRFDLKFDPDISRTQIFVYNYRVADGRCKAASSYVSNDPHGFITINQCWPESSKAGDDNGVAQEAMRAMVSDQDIEVLDYEEMKYPEIGIREYNREIVLVQAVLDENGNVIDAFSILGDKLLVPDCLTNIKKWRFRPNAKRMAIVAYLFRSPCAEAPEGQSQFVLYPPNLVTVTGSGSRSR
jgi:hypothetical protein